jgi:hypothetical protein
LPWSAAFLGDTARLGRLIRVYMQVERVVAGLLDMDAFEASVRKKTKDSFDFDS